MIKSTPTTIEENNSSIGTWRKYKSRLLINHTKLICTQYTNLDCRFAKFESQHIPPGLNCINPKFSSLLAVSSENAFTQKDRVSLANCSKGLKNILEWEVTKWLKTSNYIKCLIMPYTLIRRPITCLEQFKNSITQFAY